MLIVIAAAGYLLFQKDGQPRPFDPLNATYIIEGTPVTLINGKSLANGVSTTAFGPPASGDLNGDGMSDAAIILMQNPGGSGTFFYAAAAINTPNGASGTNAIFLGDRIAPQNISIANGVIMANYADRKPGEPMSAQPSVGVTKYLRYDGSVLRDAQNPTP